MSADNDVREMRSDSWETRRAEAVPIALASNRLRFVSLFVLAQIGRFWLVLLGAATLIATIPALILPGWSAFVVESGSMAPRIEEGDVVLVQKRDTYDPGQVIAFHNPALNGAITTHRLVGTVDGHMTTKGDANVSNDPQTSVLDDVVGLGRIKIGWIGLPVYWVHKGHWLPFSVFVASVIGALFAWRADPAGRARVPASDATHSSTDKEPNEEQFVST